MTRRSHWQGGLVDRRNDVVVLLERLFAREERPLEPDQDEADRYARVVLVAFVLHLAELLGTGRPVEEDAHALWLDGLSKVLGLSEKPQSCGVGVASAPR